MSYSAPSATTRMSASYEPCSVVTCRAAGSIAVTRSWRNSTPGFTRSRYCSCNADLSALPKRMSSFENPNVNESFWSISVTRTSSATESESRPASSSPPKPAPRITTCFTGATLRARRRSVIARLVSLAPRPADSLVLGLGQLHDFPTAALTGKHDSLGSRAAPPAVLQEGDRHPGCDDPEHPGQLGQGQGRRVRSVHPVRAAPGEVVGVVMNAVRPQGPGDPAARAVE